MRQRDLVIVSFEAQNFNHRQPICEVNLVELEIQSDILNFFGRLLSFSPCLWKSVVWSQWLSKNRIAHQIKLKWLKNSAHAWINISGVGAIGEKPTPENSRNVFRSVRAPQEHLLSLVPMHQCSQTASKQTQEAA